MTKFPHCLIIINFQGIYDLCRAICHPIGHSIDWSTCCVKEFRLAIRRKKLNGLSGWLCNNSENLPFKMSHNFFDHLNTWLFLPMLSIICASSEDFLFSKYTYMHTYHSHYNFFKCVWCISCFIFHLSFCTVVIGQCKWIVGCDWTPEIGHMKQPLILSPLS